MFEKYQQFIGAMGFNSMPPEVLAVFLLITAWSLAWKGVALWKAGRNGHKFAFVVLLICNTLGVFEILYIFFYQRIYHLIAAFYKGVYNVFFGKKK